MAWHGMATYKEKVLSNWKIVVVHYLLLDSYEKVKTNLIVVVHYLLLDMV